MSESSIRMQTYLVCGVMIGCFSILYPKIFHPMILYTLGLSKPTTTTTTHTSEQEPPIATQFNSHGLHRPRPSIRPAEGDNQRGSQKRGGLMSMILPIYAVGIVLYLIYTLSKLYKSKQVQNKTQKDEFLRHYYRGFHYDAGKAKFRMGSDESTDDDEAAGNDTTKPHETAHRSGTNDVNRDGYFDWSAAYGNEANGDIFRSAKSLPRDLEALLMKVDKSDPVDSEELSAVRSRLEHTEEEVTRLLMAIDRAERMMMMSDRQDARGGAASRGQSTRKRPPPVSSPDESATAEESEDSATEVTASEWESDEPCDEVDAQETVQ